MSDKVQSIEDKKALETIEREAKLEEERSKEAPVDASKEASLTPAPKEEKKEEKREVVLEKTMVVPLRKAYKKPLTSRANYAVRLLRSFVSRHMNVSEEKVLISPSVNQELFKQGSKNPIKRVKVKASKDKEGIVLVEFFK